jgi:hypothetical protein
MLVLSETIFKTHNNVTRQIKVAEAAVSNAKMHHQRQVRSPSVMLKDASRRRLPRLPQRHQTWLPLPAPLCSNNTTSEASGCTTVLLCVLNKKPSGKHDGLPQGGPIMLTFSFCNKRRLCSRQLATHLNSPLVKCMLVLNAAFLCGRQKVLRRPTPFLHLVS